MGLFSFLNKNGEAEVSLLLDIGNGTITGALVAFRKNKKPEFLYSTEVPFTISEKSNASKLIEEMLGLLDTLLTELMKNGFSHEFWKNKPKKIDSTLASFSSPWFVSKTKHLLLSNEHAFIITEAFIRDILKREEDAFKAELATGGNTAEDFEIIEKSIVHTKINGYTLEKSIGKKTKSLDTYLYMSTVSSGIIKKVENILLKSAHVPKERTFIHTFPLVSFTVIRDVFSASSDFIIMDITAEVTDITLVQGDVIRQSASIPSGRNFLIRQIMKAFSVTAEIAESTLKLYAEEKLNPEDTMKMDEVCVEVEKEWSIYLENALTELSPTMTLPGTLYLTAENDVAPLYIHFLGLSKVDSTATFRKGVHVIHVSEEATKDFYMMNPTVQTNEFAGLLSIFYNKIRHS